MIILGHIFPPWSSIPYGIDAIIENAAVLSLVKVVVIAAVCASPDLMQQLGVKIEDVSENEYLAHHRKNNSSIVKYFD